jgi:phage terminase small subunit
MPTPRKPAALLEMSGQLKHNPARYEHRQHEPKPTNALGNAPKHLTKEQKSCWKELSKLAPAQVLKDCDRWLVELACVLMAKLRAGTISIGESAQLLGCLSRMGLTPADRSRVAVAPQANDQDTFAELAASRQ